jgi:hypothetical protein
VFHCSHRISDVINLIVLDLKTHIAHMADSRLTAATSPLSGAPRLIVVVDTEEEFDWSKPFSRSAVAVNHIREQHRVQRILERYGVKPTYVVDYPVAFQERGYRPLREWLDDGLCDIGAHLHPWVNPPHHEELCNRNSYPGNLPEPLEQEKLARLTETIAANFGCSPTIYRAGRYGIGPGTGGILEQLGYQIDTSVVPLTDFTYSEGPNFCAVRTEPFWFGPSGRVLEVPLTVGWHGQLKNRGKELQPLLMSRWGFRFHLPGVFARLGLLERIRLTPEGTNFAELKRLTDTLLANGNGIFLLSYHSPSVVPGNTPYVRTNSDLERFLGLVDRYFEYFMGACGGVAGTLNEIHTALMAARLGHFSEPHESAPPINPRGTRVTEW